MIFPKLFKSWRRILFLLVGWQLLLTSLANIHWLDSTQLSHYLDFSGYGSLFALGICLNMLSNTDIKNLRNFLPVMVLTFYFLAKVFGSLNQSSAQDIIVAAAVLIILLSRFINFRSKSSRNIFSYLGLSSYLIYLLHVHVGLAFIIYLEVIFLQIFISFSWLPFYLLRWPAY
jgi:peptidoglycan/LPS O-acetylase OafA/YrhL